MVHSWLVATRDSYVAHSLEDSDVEKKNVMATFQAFGYARPDVMVMAYTSGCLHLLKSHLRGGDGRLPLFSKVEPHPVPQNHAFGISNLISR